MKKHALLLALLVFIQIANVLDFVMMMPLSARLTRDLHLTAQQFAALVSAYTFAAGIVGFSGAFIIDRFDRKKALLVLFGGFTLATAWCGLAQGFSGLLIARILAGSFGGIVATLVSAIVGDVIPSQDRGKAMGWVMSAFPVASVLGIPLAVWAAQYQGWHTPFLGLAVLACFAWLAVLAFAPSLRGHLAQAGPKESPVSVIRHTFSNKGQMLGLGLIGAQVLGHFSLVPMLPLFLQRNVGFQETQLPLVYLVGGLLSFVSNPVTGYLTDRYGKVRMILIICATSSIPLMVLSHLPRVPLWQALIATASFFLLSGTRFIPTSALLNDQVDSGHRGRYLGFVSCVQQIASGAASYLAGWLVVEGSTVDMPIHGFERVGYMALGFSALAAYVAYQLRGRFVPQKTMPAVYE